MMARLLSLGALLLLAGCPATKPATPTPTTGSESAPAAAPGSAPTAPAPAKAGASCESLIQSYLVERKKLNHCERDIDCAEHWPGLCPQGPFYAHRESDMSPVRALSKQIHRACVLPECEPPIALGIARCEKNRCVSGRTKPVETEFKSCWDYEETYLEGQGRKGARTYKHHQGITPRMVLGVPSAGTVTLTVTWPKACDDCRLDVSEHNSGMSNLVEGTRSKKGEVETIVLPVTKGPYYVMGRSKAGGERFRLEIDLRDKADAAMGSTFHGVSWRRLCEG